MGQLGTQAALTATAHKLARMVYLTLKHGMTYVRQSQEDYLAQMKASGSKHCGGRHASWDWR
jgi:hypothetical protein